MSLYKCRKKERQMYVSDDGTTISHIKPERGPKYRLKEPIIIIKNKEMGETVEDLNQYLHENYGERKKKVKKTKSKRHQSKK